MSNLTGKELCKTCSNWSGKGWGIENCVGLDYLPNGGRNGMCPPFFSCYAYNKPNQRSLKDPRIGQRVKPGDTFPAGTEFEYNGMKRRIEWSDGKSYLWNIDENRKFFPENTYDEPNPNFLDIFKFTYSSYKEYIVTKIGSGQPTTKQKEKEAKTMEARKISSSELEEMVEAVAEEEFGEHWDGLLQEGAVFHKNFQSFSDKNIDRVFITTASGGCDSPTGKLMFGGALFNDGHVEMRYFIGGQCPWFVYKPKAEWPEGYEQYGAFVWTDPMQDTPTVYVKEGIGVNFSGSGQAPKGFQRGFTCDTVENAVMYLNQQPSWITKKNYLED